MILNIILLFIWFLSMLLIILTISIQQDKQQANESKNNQSTTQTKSYGTTLSGEPVFIKNTTTINQPKPLPTSQVDKIIESYLKLNITFDPSFLKTLYDCTTTQQLYKLIDTKISTRLQ